MTKETLRKPFSLARVALLMKNRALEDFPGVAIGAGILAGINILTIIIGGRAVVNDSGGQLWTMFISLTGLLLAGSAFKGMHDGRSGTDWILLPATDLEKYAAALVTYLIVFPLASAVAMTGLSAFVSLVELVAGGPGGRIWNPLHSAVLSGWIDYATGTLILAAGSATFRKRALIKTIGVTIAYVLVASGILLAAVYFVRKAGGLPMPDFVNNNGDLRIAGDLSIKTPPAIDTIMGIARYALVPIFALLYGYFRVAEKEARDEVQ
ncbi:MAG TPA: hypothetical protein VN437_05425 [Rectinemataceae bacterium]|nr:hypothetical protein [Rectinemataceae bacterium]